MRAAAAAGHSNSLTAVERTPSAVGHVSRIARLGKSGLAWGFLVSIATVVWALAGLGGRNYYATPLAVRGYAPAHPILKPSGPVGQTFGVVGTLLMIVPFVYMGRKRLAFLKHAGSARTWLEIHLFCGVVGPVLVTLHTSFKFNGLVSAAYWSMVAVMLSGFVGRYLFVRIPRSIRGNELTRAELDAQAEALQEELTRWASASFFDRLRLFEASVVPPGGAGLSTSDLLFGEVTLRWKLRALGRELDRSGVPASLRDELLRLTAERAVLLRRIAYLQRTKRLFGLWHVFHLPLVYVLLIIAAAHIAVALYLGYVPFRW